MSFTSITKKIIGFFAFTLLLMSAQGFTHEMASSQLTVREATMGQLVAFPDITAYVNEIGQKLGKVSDYPAIPYQFVVLNSSEPNAWAFRGGKIAITRGMLMLLEDESQLAAVLAHEIGHETAFQRLEIAHSRMEQAFLGEKLKENFVALSQVATSTKSAVEMQLMKQEEFAADADGIKLMARAGYDLEGAIKLQNIFLKLSSNTPSSWTQHIFDTHPSTQERLVLSQAIIAQQTPTGSYRGEERFNTLLASLKKAKPAYDLFEQGKSVVEKDPTQAKALALDALKLLPNEALFHGLLGKAESLLLHDDAAIKAYSKAIELDNNYYAFHLGRGAVLFHQHHYQEARQELDRSLQLYPTPDADYMLGIIDLDRDISSAIEHFRFASSEQNSIGNQANLELLKLESFIAF